MRSDARRGTGTGQIGGGRGVGDDRGIGVICVKFLVIPNINNF